MQDILYSLITQLQANSDLTAVVPSANILRGNLPQNPTFSPSSPYIVITRISKMRDVANNTGHYSTIRVQVTAFATSDYQAEQISELVADSLSGLSNTVINGVFIALIDDAGGFPDNSDGLTLGVFRANHDFMIYYSYR